MFKNTVLVTGAPRSGTTPVGQLLSMLPKSALLYEPMGLTGDKAINLRFPIPGEPDFSLSDLSTFVNRMRNLDMSFKSQRRPGHKGFSGMAARLIGSRSLISYYNAKLSIHKRDTLIWKDPHGVFCAAAGADVGFRSIVSVRSPYAHAASFKRLGWVSPVSDIYARYCLAFGEISEFDDWCVRVGKTPYGSAALLWHLTHKPLVPLSREVNPSIYIFNMERVAEDELVAYRALFDWLGEEMPRQVESKIIFRNRSKGDNVPNSTKVHNFNRTAAQANSYWKTVLTKDEIQLVEEINGSLWNDICAT